MGAGAVWRASEPNNSADMQDRATLPACILGVDSKRKAPKGLFSVHGARLRPLLDDWFAVAVPSQAIATSGIGLGEFTQAQLCVAAGGEGREQGDPFAVTQTLD